MRITAAELCKRVGGELCGEGGVLIERAAGLQAAGPGDVTFARREHLKHVAASPAAAVLVPERVPGARATQIVVSNPYFAFVTVLGMVEQEQRRHPAGIHPTAVIGARARLGAGVALGAHAVIGEDARIDDGAIIHPNVTLGAGCRIGAGAIIYSNVAIRERCSVGKRSIIHSGTTIGGDGFGYLQVDGRHVKVPQVGTVEIGDDVEIGCNCTVDRATIDKTVIENGVKIDNHSHIAHNCRIGEHSMLIAYARMGGSTVVGKGVLLAEDVGLTNGITIGDRSIIGGSSKVSRSWPAGSVLWGFPAQPMEDEKRQVVLIKKLPRIYEAVKEIQKRLGIRNSEAGEQKPGT